jgi:hypothetical protein
VQRGAQAERPGPDDHHIGVHQASVHQRPQRPKLYVYWVACQMPAWL